MHHNLLKYLAICCVGVAAFAASADRVQANFVFFAHLQPNDPNDFVVLSDLLNGEVPGVVVGFTQALQMTTEGHLHRDRMA